MYLGKIVFKLLKYIFCDTQFIKPAEVVFALFTKHAHEWESYTSVTLETSAYKDPFNQENYTVGHLLGK